MSRTGLVIDIGNTSVTIGVYEGQAVHRLCRTPTHQDVESGMRRVLDGYADLRFDHASIASVVPRATPGWINFVEATLGLPVWELRPEADLGIPIDYPHPESIGPDRLANAVAAVRLVGTPVAVADFGTALTFDVVLPERGYVGGIIAPGIAMMYDYMAERTALLPRLKPAPASTVIGRNTAEAMHAGAYYGYRGMVREMITEIRRQTNCPDMTLVATGGLAPTVLEGFDLPISLQPQLTLLGIGFAGDFANRRPL